MDRPLKRLYIAKHPVDRSVGAMVHLGMSGPVRLDMQYVTPAYLLPAELIGITGYRQKSKQRQWLKKQKIQFLENAFGHPIVGRSYWDALNGQSKRGVVGPNWDAPTGAAARST